MKVDSVITADMKEQIKSNLLQARGIASSYLEGFDPEELRLIIEAAAEELDVVDFIPDRGDGFSFGFSVVDFLHQSVDPDDENDIYQKIDEMVVGASDALSSVEAGLRRLEDDPDINDYLLASEACTNAYRSLYSGLIAKHGADYWRSEEAERLANKHRGRTEGGKKRHQPVMVKNGDTSQSEFIINEYMNLCAHPTDKIVVEHREKAKGLEKEVNLDTTYNIRRNGKINAFQCAAYIFHKYSVLPEYMGKEPYITWTEETVYEHICTYVKEKEAETLLLMHGM